MIEVKRPPGLKLGDRAKDKISGFTGVVVAITNWLNGCQRVTIQPEELKDGRPIENCTFDAEQVEIVAHAMPAEAEPVAKGGPSIAPVRSSDPR
jgi:hypothetical protein